MEYRTLGSTGTVVSSQCLGTMTFGKESTQEVSHAQLDRFVERGGTPSSDYPYGTPGIEQRSRVLNPAG
jgi:hypothetical protein